MKKPLNRDRKSALEPHENLIKIYRGVNIARKLEIILDERQKLWSLGKLGQNRGASWMNDV